MDTNTQPDPNPNQPPVTPTSTPKSQSSLNGIEISALVVVFLLVIHFGATGCRKHSTPVKKVTVVQKKEVKTKVSHENTKPESQVKTDNTKHFRRNNRGAFPGGIN